MVELDERVLRTAGERGKYLLETEFVGIVERYHTDSVGVEWPTLEAYADEIAADGAIDADAFLEAVRSSATESETWVDDDSVYWVSEGRLSRYPRRWHDDLGDTEDVVAFVEYLVDEADGYRPEAGAGGPAGIPQDELLDVVSTVGPLDRATANDRLEDRRDEGVLVEDADQHPSGNVYLGDRVDGVQSGDI